MKAITEFPSFTLDKAIAAKTALAAEGKSPEEISTGLGEKFKMEGDKLKYFVNAIEVAMTHKENLKRVLVFSLNEGENAPAKAVKIEELVYVPEPLVVARAPQEQGDRKGGRGNQRGGRGGGDSKKSSPWGLSPEEKAAKKGPKAPAKA
jgi:hypothetical protein